MPEGTRFTIEDSVEEGNELSRRNVVAEKPIDFAAELGRAFRVAGKGAHRGLHIGHQQSGRYTFSDHVGNADSQPVLTEP